MNAIVGGPNFDGPAVAFPPEIEKLITTAIAQLTPEMRENGSIPDDWRIDVTFEPVRLLPADQNVVRVVATPRPPYNRFIEED